MLQNKEFFLFGTINSVVAQFEPVPMMVWRQFCCVHTPYAVLGNKSEFQHSTFILWKTFTTRYILLQFTTLIDSCSFWIPINSKPWQKRGHLHTYHVTAYFKCNPLFRSILEVDDSLDLFTCLFYTNITLLVVTDWENRNVDLKLGGGGRSPNDEDLIVPNWNWWSWLVDNNQMIVQVAREQNKEIKEMF